jgi:hypothetical protein
MSTPPGTPSHDAIAQRARTLWQAAGSPEGQDLAFWLRAEKELRDESHKTEDLASDDDKETHSSKASVGMPVRTAVSTPSSSGPSQNPFAKTPARSKKPGR